MTQPLVPVDNKTGDWPRKIAQAINWLIKNVSTAGGSAVWGGITGTLSDQTDLSSALGGKQATLVSSTNIKTVNSSTLLGSGNLAVGTVTSVAASVPTGFSIGGSPITSSGTLAVSFSAGYSLPSDATQANWTTAFGWGNHAAAGYLTTAAAAAAYQPLDTQLTSVAALSYSGNSLKVLRVNAGETDFELATLSGTGTVTTTGSPASGNLAKFSGATSIVNGDLSGDVTTSGTLVTTIANSAVTLAKQANVATGTVFYRKTAGSGAPEVQTLATLKTDLGLTGTNSGDQAWKLVDQSGAVTTGSTWTFSTNVAQVDVTGLGSYSEIKVAVRNITLSVSGQRVVRVSTDGGSTFYSSSGDYDFFDNLGAESAINWVALHGTASASARSGTCHIIGSNLNGTIKLIEQPARALGYYFDASTSPIDAIRVLGSAGGNLTGGSIYVFVR